MVKIKTQKIENHRIRIKKIQTQNLKITLVTKALQIKIQKILTKRLIKIKMIIKKISRKALKNQMKKVF